MITKQKTNQINKNPTDFKASDLKEKHEIAASIQKVTSRRAIIFFKNKTCHFPQFYEIFHSFFRLDLEFHSSDRIRENEPTRLNHFN